ncbi:MAG: hypothetical protein ABS79_00505 [Planctomycetes bacterium SCN 63-9]|nr:MAG: hypothetical protein ABS79_00505 [Planctomycetes bacterium SCN 63-9]
MDELAERATGKDKLNHGAYNAAFYSALAAVTPVAVRCRAAVDHELERPFLGIASSHSCLKGEQFDRNVDIRRMAWVW